MYRNLHHAAGSSLARPVVLALGAVFFAACSDEHGGLLAPAVTTSPTFARGGSGDNNGRILFTSTRDEGTSTEIYSMNPDGSGVTRLTNSVGNDKDPAWSPDGKRIAFVSMRHDPQGEIYVMNADGTGVVRLTFSPGGDASPTWSKDGKRIAFTSRRDDLEGDIYIMNDDGSGVTRVTNTAGADLDPSWSPDGKQIAFVSGRDRGTASTTDLYTVALADLQVTRLTNEGTQVRHASWAPGGKQIAFHTTFDPGDANVLTSDVFVYDVDLRQLTRITGGPASGGEDSYPSWSPDGKQIAFASTRTGARDIYVMNADGSQQTRLTTSAADDYAPAWNR